ncbi:MAG: hypothetical protein ACI4PE_03440 [Bacilli bacterium]
MEINKKSNWIAILVYHERYYFSTEVGFYGNETLKTVVEDSGYDITKLEEKRTGFYMLDITSRRPISEYEYETGKVTGVEHIQPQVLLLIDLNQIDFSHNDFNEFIWGHTNTKFGLLDLKKD